MGLFGKKVNRKDNETERVANALLHLKEILKEGKVVAFALLDGNYEVLICGDDSDSGKLCISAIQDVKQEC